MPDIEIVLLNAGNTELVRLAVPANTMNDYTFGSPPVAVTRLRVRNVSEPPPPPPERDAVIAFLRRASMQASCPWKGAWLIGCADLLQGDDCDD